MVKCLKCGKEAQLRVTYAEVASTFGNCAIIRVSYESVCGGCGDMYGYVKYITVEVS